MGSISVSGFSSRRALEAPGVSAVDFTEISISQRFSKMSIISYPAEPASLVPSLLVEPGQPGIFSFLMTVLDVSRQRQARRILRRYEHLVAPSAHHVSHE